MNVLLVHQAFASPQNPGGTRHYELARDLRERGIQFTIVASDVSYSTGRSTVAGPRRLAQTQSVEGVTVTRVWTYASLHRSFVWRVFSFLSFMLTSFVVGVRVREIDVVMGTTPPLFQAVSAWAIAAIRRKPFLLEVRDLWPEFAIDMGVLTNPLLIALSRGLESFLYDRATHILVNSPAYRDYLIGKGVPARKVTLIANGVAPEMFDPAASGEEFRRQWAADAQFVATYAGALGMANDIPTILGAAQRLREEKGIRFLIVGDGKERPSLEEQVRQSGLENVTFTGALPKQQMKEVLAASDACIATLRDIPMFRTTYPNKVFDYMAAGRPTLLGIDGVIRSVVEAAGAGLFVQPGDADALAASVLALSRNPEAARAMGDRARDYVVLHFNRHDQSRAFGDLVVTLAG